MISLSRHFLLALILCSLYALDKSSADSISASELANLQPQECNALVKAVLQARLEKYKNVDITSVTRLDFYKDDIHLGSKSRGRVFQLLSLGYSYRLEGQVYLKSIPQGENDSNWSIKSSSNYDQVSGIANSVGRQKDRETIGGLIRHERDDTIDLNPMAFFFDLDLPEYMFGDEQTSFIRGIIKNSASWNLTFDTTNNHVKISYKFSLRWPLDGEVGEPGEATFDTTLDCSKGMMPVFAQCRYGSQGKNALWRKETHWLKNPENFNGFWIPTEITTEILSSSATPGLRVRQTTEVIEFTQGQVKQDDLKIVFPEKTRVRDFTRGVAYTIGADGKPVGPEAPLYRPAVEVSEPSSAIRVPMLWMTGLVVLVLAIVAFRKRSTVSEGV